MIKLIFKTSIIIIIIIVSIILYLSFFGINTSNFNDKIKNEIQNINKNVNLELNTVKLLLNLSDFSINIKTFGPKIKIDNRRLELESITTNVSIKSFLKDDFSIDDLQISTKTINLKDLVLLARSIKNSPQLFILDNIIKGGIVVGDINLNFDNKGKIKKDYEIKGFIKDAKLDIFKKHSIDYLNLIFNINNKSYNLKDIEGNFDQINLSLPIVNIIEKKNSFLFNGKLISKKNNIEVKLLNKVFDDNFKKFNVDEVDFTSDSDFTFLLNKRLKVTDLKLKSLIELNKLVYRNNLSNIKKYLPNFKDSIDLENHQISINYQKDKIQVSGKGKIKIQNKVDKIDYEILKNNNQYIFSSNININENPVLIEFLQYEKKEGINSILKLNGSYKKNGEINLKSVSFNENNNNFLFQKLSLNKNFEILNIKLLELDYINNNEIKNQIKLKKDKKNYLIFGKSFDLSKIITETLNNNDDNESPSIFKNFNTIIDIKIEKAYLDNVLFVKNLVTKINYKNDEIYKLDLDSSFSNNKKLTLTINTNDKNEKITTFFSANPKPLVKEYKFIKGFEEGALDFYSIKKNGVSNSLLTIDNFKIKEVPVFAKLLSLASLQGIADLLTGEGIRFSDFEMKFSNKKGLMTIEEMYAIGPAVSILMEGYIESKKIISLRGTLVPATTINRSIASIPLIGGILVGKKVGEGVFGVSFKIKGPPKSLKTSVNPVKTLTPRFITRTLEKIKKN